MPLSDLVAALPGIVLWELLPGLIVARILWPDRRWWWQLAATPGLSAGLIAAIGLVERLVRVPFHPMTVAPVIIGCALIAYLRRPRAREVTSDGAGPAVPIAALVAGSLSALACIAILSQAPLPPFEDTALHGEVARAIASTHSVLPAVPVPVAGTATVRTQMGAEAIAALVSATGGPEPARCLLPLGMAPMLVLPLGIAALAWNVTRRRLVAALTPLLGVGLLLPAAPIAFGEIPLLIDSTLVVPLLLAVLAWLDHGDRSALFTTAALGAAVWLVHGTEIFTVAILVAPRLGAMRRFGRIVLRAAALGAVSAICVGGLIAIEHRPTLAPVPAATDQSAPFGYGTVLPLIPLLVTTYQVICPALIGLPLLVAGVWRSRREGCGWLAGAHVLTMLIVLDRGSWHLAGPLWIRLFPWSVIDRLWEIQYFVVPALGAVALAWVYRRLASSHRRLGVVVSAAATATAIGLGLTNDVHRFGGAIAQHQPASAADLAALRDLQTQLPHGLTILGNPPVDAGRWIGALTDDHLLLPKVYIDINPDDWHLTAMASACTDQQAALRALADADAAYVSDGVDENGRHPWPFECIRRLPNMETLIDVRENGHHAMVIRIRRRDPRG